MGERAREREREKVRRQEGQTENGHEMQCGGDCVTAGEARDGHSSSQPDYPI